MANDNQGYETEAEFRSRIEAVPVHGDVSPFVRSIQQRRDCLHILLQVLSPGRFLPVYWKRFGLPDLAKEFLELDMKTRIEGLRGRLKDDEIEQLRGQVRAAAEVWQDWRRRALDAHVLDPLQLSEGRARDLAWLQWMDDNRAMKQEWDDLGDCLAEAERYVQRLAVLADARVIEQNEDGGRVSKQELDSVNERIPEAERQVERASEHRGEENNPKTSGDAGCFSPKELAEKHSLSYDAVRKALARLRKKDHDCFVEVEDHAGNEPRFLYRWDTVRPTIERMKQRSEMSNCCPPQKK